MTVAVIRGSSCETFPAFANFGTYWDLGTVDAIQDCNNQVGGHAYIDDCSDCSGGGAGLGHNHNDPIVIQSVMKVQEMVKLITAQKHQIQISGIMMVTHMEMLVIPMMIMMEQLMVLIQMIIMNLFALILMKMVVMIVHLELMMSTVQVLMKMEMASLMMVMVGIMMVMVHVI